MLTNTVPASSENSLGDEPEQAYYTVRCYNASGIGVTHEMLNVYAKSEADAKEVMQLQYRIPQGLLYCLYAFKQEGKIDMRAYNEPREAILGCDLEPHVEDELRGSCCLCGRQTRRIICYRCVA